MEAEAKEAAKESLKEPAPKQVLAKEAKTKEADSKSTAALASDGKNPAKGKEEKVEIPEDHPYWKFLQSLKPNELDYVVKEFVNNDRKQQNSQLAEMVTIRVVIEPGAKPGDRELRLLSPAGLSNPLRFQVGQFPEVLEHEPNNPDWPDTQRVETPVLLNGQILPGDVDRFRFEAKRGENLVVQAQARHLMPYLADAVPGWFQATLALYDRDGKELAFTDDFGFDPDPIFFFLVAEDGQYQLEIRDAIYRGREDFVYRITVGEFPFITSIFPLGAREGAQANLQVKGWNLGARELKFGTRPGAPGIRQAAFNLCNHITNTAAYAVDSLPECLENEPNNQLKDAQTATLPLIINGTLSKPGDVDFFRIEGRAAETVVIEVLARRLNSPLDSLIRLKDESGKILALNDDFEDKGAGLQTHHADSYLSVKLPKDGAYYIQLSDTRNHGGDGFGYRLRISPPRPDFALRVTPSSINAPAGRPAVVSVHAFRKDGFSGPIELDLKNAPSGFSMQGARIPSGCDRVRLTLTAPRQTADQTFAANIEGRAKIGDEIVTRPAIPAEDMMQAFAYMHLAPSQELRIAIMDAKRRGPGIEVANHMPIQVPEGGAARVKIKAPQAARFTNVKLEMSDPPKGVTLKDVRVTSSGLSFSIASEMNTAKAGFEDNLIVEAFGEPKDTPPNAKNPPANPKKAAKRQRVSLGVLPAIPCEIVQAGTPPSPEPTDEPRIERPTKAAKSAKPATSAKSAKPSKSTKPAQPANKPLRQQRNQRPGERRPR